MQRTRRNKPDNRDICISPNPKRRIAPEFTAGAFLHPAACATGLDSADALGYSGIDQDRLACILILLKSELYERREQDRSDIRRRRRNARNDTETAAFHAAVIVDRLLIRRRRRRDVDLMLMRAMRHVMMVVHGRRGRPRRWRGRLCQARLPRQSARSQTNRQNPGKCLSQNHTHPRTLAENARLHQGKPIVLIRHHGPSSHGTSRSSVGDSRSGAGACAGRESPIRLCQ